MDQDLKEYLDANFGRMDEKFAEVEKRVLEVEKRVLEGEKRVLTEVDKRVEKLETSLLGAFYGWARPMEMRVHGMTSTVMGFEERLGLAEQRISELERKRAS
jgi:hypothetical protein